ncbi:hypothetical protein Sez_1713 [Streptococcus equi subsp. zooepidemicus MGCS10565]|uniref:Uncharacterized protein n=1 Tax=Streptococcus equi subsp. zooepidemicus (strain MGCS10565) TaxID=552526 RepID=B4U4X5_STREM|nr:hypothetical protein Sez_1713 [Streptococcus equi subsp. zooepidemicus MGCS10565]
MSFVNKNLNVYQPALQLLETTKSLHLTTGCNHCFLIVKSSFQRQKELSLA